ncbi:helix-turn-helix domain-containing protein, partial [Propionibacterium acidifaciens]|uniref:helix-turn-helix domain-containing protein n=1 Tax=Propionibacterium acidifaciens TaxID=556499 RepID=UPI0039EC1B41
MQVEVTPEETAVLIRWKKRSDNHVLVRMKAEAILYASEGVGIDIIAKMVERAERTVQEWLADWQATRMCSVLTGHAGNQNAAKLTRDQKQELKKILVQPPSQTGIHAGFWDVPAIRDVVKIMFDVEHQADSSYQLPLRFCGLSLEPPGPVRQAPQRESHHPTHDRSENPSQKLVGRRLGGLHGRRGPLGARGRDPPHAAPERTTHQTVRGPAEDVPV